MVVHTSRPAHRMADTSSSHLLKHVLGLHVISPKYTITLLWTFLDLVHGYSKYLRKLSGVAVTIYQQTRPYTPYDVSLCTIQRRLLWTESLLHAVTGLGKGDRSAMDTPVLGRIPTTYLVTQQFRLPVCPVLVSALGVYANTNRREKASLNCTHM